MAGAWCGGGALVWAAFHRFFVVVMGEQWAPLIFIRPSMVSKGEDL